MEPQFSKIFKRVLIAHVLVFVLFMGHSVIARLLEPKQEIVVPVEFMVDVRPPMPDNVADMLPDTEPERPPEPVEPPHTEPEIPDPAPVAPPPPPKKKPRKRPEIEISKKRITRTLGGKTASSKQLSSKDIEKLLAAGAVAGDHTSIPDEDSRCMAVIKNTLYALWDQPAREDVGNASAVMKLRFGSGGSVSRAFLSKRSGNSALDSSVERVADDIRRIRGLTAGFLKRHPTVTISFSVD